MVQVEERDYLAQMQEEVTRLTQPLLDQYNGLDGEIKKREREIVSMRKARTQMRTMIRAINPELIPVNGKPKKKGVEGAPSGERLDAFTDWLRENADEIDARGGVHASGLRNDKGGTEWPTYPQDLIGHQSGISKALQVLHDRGIVRLDHVGNGGAKFFKVVR
jgi:hypothetical protein